MSFSQRAPASRHERQKNRSRTLVKSIHRASVVRQMTESVLTVTEEKTIAEARQILAEKIKFLESINYLYVLDKEENLVGILSIKDLYRLNNEQAVGEVCKRSPLVTVFSSDHQEKAAYLAVQHNLKAIPVVDEKNKFLGVVAEDAIMSILHRELRDDLLHLGGVHHAHKDYDNVLEISLFNSIKHRLPWLVVGLFGGLFAAQIISRFESTLEKNLILAAFIPLVVYITDAVGTQLEAFTIRDFALFRRINFFRYFLRQFLIVLIIAVFLGATLSLWSLIFHSRGDIALVLGSAVLVATTSSLFSGLFVPYAFRKFGFDPANASGPLGTIIQDILSVFIYFVIASQVL